ncbi:hypothetical protein D9758_004138 [Tetrapyrgos nigripes]|uniref:Uncharacterized protein n=1 Tax=Tetrapyrgos nigripes TaxID=182062 RepID=A0A8H5GU00_9AGAR|nr:hypothetical protein D9758_004138 [Tetrapyrgos nigripes]
MHPFRLSVDQIFVLTALVHPHTPHYRLYYAQACYHTRMIWKIANMLAGINEESMLRSRRAAFAEAKQKVQSNVVNDALVMKEKFHEVWRSDFRASIFDRPLREAEAEKDSAWAQLQEAKSRRDEAFDLVQVLEGQLAELRRASTHSTKHTLITLIAGLLYLVSLCQFNVCTSIALTQNNTQSGLWSRVIYTET